MISFGARLVAPAGDWAWLKAIKGRLAARAVPRDRFDRLVPSAQTLNLGIELMDQALQMPTAVSKRAAIQYRDGLMLSILSLWPIRRRSLAALTVSRHIEFDKFGVNILLYPADTKGKRAETFRVPPLLVPYVRRYLDDIRPRLLGRGDHDGFWASNKNCPLSGQQMYAIARARLFEGFGKDMCLHDFRRSAATFLAMDAPEKIELIPGVLQHASPRVSHQQYNLARSTEASRRFGDTISSMRTELRSRSRTTRT